MRSPKRKRPQIRKLEEPSSEIDLSALAQHVRYEGSPEHKRYPLPGSQPKLRADASECDRSFIGKESELTQCLQAALAAGQVGGPWENGFPRYVWYRIENMVYEARLSNQGQGVYKGYPLEPGEAPEGLP